MPDAKLFVWYCREPLDAFGSDFHEERSQHATRVKREVGPWRPAARRPPPAPPGEHLDTTSQFIVSHGALCYKRYAKYEAPLDPPPISINIARYVGSWDRASLNRYSPCSRPGSRPGSRLLSRGRDRLTDSITIRSPEHATNFKDTTIHRSRFEF
ncbi:hypothetical protein EVAR_35615_1 [Eumeta japonica]|uniref:Uncharacterized protein n=1 Tax=Eumeta variegata TaxID=151549 RepID=A0A4C1WFS5_EUMVA|nr:hypothetical protein EVAR_35615_1 [Eumeta japonica]